MIIKGMMTIEINASGDQVGTEGIDDLDLGELPDRNILANVHHTIDLGCFAMASRDALLIDQDLHRRANQVVATSSGDVILHFAQLSESLIHQPLRYDPFTLRDEVSRIRTALVAIGKKPAPVELCFFDEVQQLVVIGLGLTGIPDDEVAPKRCIGFSPTNVVDAIEESLAIAPSPHSTQQRLRHVLK